MGWWDHALKEGTQEGGPTCRGGSTFGFKLIKSAPTLNCKAGQPGGQLCMEVWSGEASGAGCVPWVCGAKPASGQAFSGSGCSLDGIFSLETFQSWRDKCRRKGQRTIREWAKGAYHVVQPKSPGAWSSQF